MDLLADRCQACSAPQVGAQARCAYCGADVADLREVAEKGRFVAAFTRAPKVPAEAVGSVASQGSEEARVTLLLELQREESRFAAERLEACQRANGLVQVPSRGVVAWEVFGLAAGALLTLALPGGGLWALLVVCLAVIIVPIEWARVKHWEHIHEQHARRKRALEQRLAATLDRPPEPE